MEVQISGCVFSSLFLELANSQGDVEGFLLGDIEDVTETTVSDTQDVNIQHNRIFAVQEIAVCQGLFSFYDGVGHVHSEKLDRILGNKRQAALGWFKFRRNTRLGVSMREKAVHKSLLEQFGIEDSENFIFSVFSSQHTDNLATHAYNYLAFYCKTHHSRGYEAIPIKIINLGNTAQTEYKHKDEPTTSTSKLYQNVIGSFRDEFLDNVGQLQQVRHARSMYKNMLIKMKGLKKTVHKSETQLKNLSDDIEILKEQLERAKQEKRSRKEARIDLIVLDDESDQDLMSFEDVDTQDKGSKNPTKHLVVAGHIDSHSVQEKDFVEISANHVNTMESNGDNKLKTYNLRKKSPQY
ncbi:BRISC complex subunit Abraxas 2-like [Dendronephthya gigantea]|uniref:BRISC complex subunit Abraxas 2-like n=1 Tax=Dendronephthya gigantea TaxID=151771 RepID=UPI00106D9A20|nr:BRISC complex subunit Abraxas 2-like [Dendronephthya gigantea]